jgi:hypothetical protein
VSDGLCYCGGRATVSVPGVRDCVRQIRARPSQGQHRNLRVREFVPR